MKRVLIGALCSVLLIACSSSSKQKVLGDTSKSSSASATSTSTTSAKAQDLVIESGWSSQVDHGTRHSWAGAAVTNPNASLAAYDVSVVFNLIDTAGTVVDTETETISYIAPGARVLVAPQQIGFDVKTEPADLKVNAIGDMKPDKGSGGASGFSTEKGVTLTVVSAGVDRGQYVSKIKGQVENPTSDVVKYPTVRCIYTHAGVIVGGEKSTISDPIAPGATVAFSAGLNFSPEQADGAECQAVA